MKTEENLQSTLGEIVRRGIIQDQEQEIALLHAALEVLARKLEKEFGPYAWGNLPKPKESLSSSYIRFALKQACKNLRRRKK